MDKVRPETQSEHTPEGPNRDVASQARRRDPVPPRPPPPSKTTTAGPARRSAAAPADRAAAAAKAVDHLKNNFPKPTTAARSNARPRFTAALSFASRARENAARERLRPLILKGSLKGPPAVARSGWGAIISNVAF